MKKSSSLKKKTDEQGDLHVGPKSLRNLSETCIQLRTYTQKHEARKRKVHRTTHPAIPAILVRKICVWPPWTTPGSPSGRQLNSASRVDLVLCLLLTSTQHTARMQWTALGTLRCTTRVSLDPPSPLPPFRSTLSSEPTLSHRFHTHFSASCPRQPSTAMWIYAENW